MCRFIPFQTQTQTCCPACSGERHPLNSCYAPYILVSSAWFAFFLPCYATFKVLSHRPINEAELQKHAMYWSVIGAVVAFEYIAEWLISWQVQLITPSGTPLKLFLLRAGYHSTGRSRLFSSYTCRCPKFRYGCTDLITMSNYLATFRVLPISI